MVDLPRVFRNALSGPGSGEAGGGVSCVGVVEGAIQGAGRMASLAALFPQVTFETLGPTWPAATPANVDILLVGLSAASAEDIESAIRRLKVRRHGLQVVIALYDADVMTTRRLLREGAADVLPAPVTEPSLAACLERLLAQAEHSAQPRSSGEIVAVLKAGGGVGASSLCVQLAAMISGGGNDVCLADLDLQFGCAGLYLDLPEAVTIADCLGSGSIEETPFHSALAKHRSGVRLLAAPREMVPLETLGPPQAAALLAGLRRDFRLTIVELPPVWTAWTNEILHLADRIMLVTHLSAPHVQLVKRQLRVLASQSLDGKPLTLVCNAPSADHTATVTIKAAERALGRSFDAVIPEDRRTMMAATNQGVEISAIRRGTKLEKAIAELAGKISALAIVDAGKRR
jgi:pilus assembly protein CpaE